MPPPPVGGSSSSRKMVAAIMTTTTSRGSDVSAKNAAASAMLKARSRVVPTRPTLRKGWDNGNPWGFYVVPT